MGLIAPGSGVSSPTTYSLTAEAEEMLTEYVRLGGTTGGDRGAPTLLGSTEAATRFWDDWRLLYLPDQKSCPIRGLADIDVSAIRAWLARHGGRRAAAADRRDRRPPPEAFAVVDGVRQNVAPFAIELPGVFVGRNNSELTGRIRRRLRHSEVTLNLGPGAPVPGKKASWGRIVRDPTMNWIAMWKDPLTRTKRYAWLEHQGLRAKYDLARRMCRRLPAMRAECARLLAADDRRARQLGACLWTIEHLGIRVGRTTNDTAHGATTLLVRHVAFPPSANLVRFDFPGKDGVRYLRTVRAPPAVAAALREAALRGRKHAGDPLFDLVTAESVNDAIQAVLRGATAKVLRTCRACHTFESTLLSVERAYIAAPGGRLDWDEAHLALQFAFVRTAIFCNHRAGCHAGSVLDASALEPVVDKLQRDARPGGALSTNAVRSALTSRVVRPGCLGLYTARTSYIDGRIIAAFCERNGFPVEDAFHAKNKLPARFKWVLGTPGTFRFCGSH